MNPNTTKYRNNPTTDPLTTDVEFGMRQAITRNMAKDWPAEPIRKSFLRPTDSIKKYDIVAAKA